MTSSLKLEVGKTYRARNGARYTILSDDKHQTYPMNGNGNECWMRDGRYVDEARPSGYDLVEEVRDPAAPDPVNQPAHYTQGGVECIEAIKAAMTAEAFAGYLRGNAVKYLWRYEHKGGVESLKKARWYLDRLITETA
jgi:hypothetical protein